MHIYYLNTHLHWLKKNYCLVIPARNSSCHKCIKGTTTAFSIAAANVRIRSFGSSYSLIRTSQSNPRNSDIFSLLRGTSMAPLPVAFVCHATQLCVQHAPITCDATTLDGFHCWLISRENRGAHGVIGHGSEALRRRLPHCWVTPAQH